MGLSNFPCQADGVLPMLVLNTILSVTLFKNMMVKYVLHVVGASSNLDEDYSSSENIFYHEASPPPPPRRRRWISTTKYETLCKSRVTEEEEENSKNGEKDDEKKNIWSSSMECCVCLNRFEGDEEVSELSCKHFFHKGCLDKWFDNQHTTTTCPLCRSTL